ncbi:hypothetical protein BH18ACI1_BH18ACI1_02100 [soil metagenome]
MKTNTKSNLKQTVIITVSGLIFIGLLAAGISTFGNWTDFTRTAQAQEEIKSNTEESNFHCSNATLTGRYATRGDGFVPGGPPPAPFVPFATVSMMTFDGDGRLSNNVTTSTNGTIGSSVNPGTYMVNADCTGRMTIMIPAPPCQLTFNLVIADRGEEFYLIATTPSIVTVGGKRLQ